MRFLHTFSRLVVGGLFIFSGLIKLNDPTGTAIKMEEYFEVFASDFGGFFHKLIPWSMEISFALILLELMLGLAVLLYYKMPLTAWILVGLMVFFSLLTFYSAYFNKVTDCGCFGEVIKLTPWQSFYKDIFLMAFVLHLFWYRKSFEPLLLPNQGLLALASWLIISLCLGLYALGHLPFIDFTAYRIGTHIGQQMMPAESPVFEYTFTKNGEEVKSSSFLSTQEGYTYVSSRVTNEDQVTPKISDYGVMDKEGNDLTAKTLAGKILLVIVQDVGLAEPSPMETIRRLAKYLDGKVTCLLLTSSPPEQAEAFRHRWQLAFPCYYTDATVLKTMIRSNPGLTLWENGIVRGKWAWRDIPSGPTVRSLLHQ